MAQNTALQTLINEVDSLLKRLDSRSPVYEAYKAVYVYAVELLPKERKDILDGYKNGFYAGCDQPLMDNMPDDYYTNTFNQ